MSYWAEEPYKIGMPTPDEIMAPMPPHVEVAYLQHLAAQVALDWGELASACGDDPVPKWITAAMGKLDTVVDDLGELLVYLDAQMPAPPATSTEVDEAVEMHPDELVDDETVEVAECPYCHTFFRAPAGHDPLKKHFDYCTKRPDGVGEPDPKWLCVKCNQDGTNPVEHEDDFGHWPEYR